MELFNIPWYFLRPTYRRWLTHLRKLEMEKSKGYHSPIRDKRRVAIVLSKTVFCSDLPLFFSSFSFSLSLSLSFLLKQLEYCARVHFILLWIIVAQSGIRVSFRATSTINHRKNGPLYDTRSLILPFSLSLSLFSRPALAVNSDKPRKKKFDTSRHSCNAIQFRHWY